jgi:hypothetical protein
VDPADQYIWLIIDCFHLPMTSQSFSFAALSSFLPVPRKDHFSKLKVIYLAFSLISFILKVEVEKTPCSLTHKIGK